MGMTAVTDTVTDVIVTYRAMTRCGLPVTTIEIAPAYLYGWVTWQSGGRSYYIVVDKLFCSGKKKPAVGDRACTDDHPDPLDLDPETLPR